MQLVDCAGHPSPESVVAAGYAGVCVYLSEYSPKAVTPAQVAAYLTANLNVIFVYEDGAQDVMSPTLMAGHGATCAQQLAAITFAVPDFNPADCVVYLAADFDVVGSQFAQAWDGHLTFFENVRCIAGDYGGDDWLAFCAAQGITYLWTSAAWHDADAQYHKTLLQELGYVTVGGVECDVDTVCFCDFGQWPRPTAPAPVPPPPPPPPPPDPLLEVLNMVLSDPGFAVRFLTRELLKRGVDAASYTNLTGALANGTLSLDGLMAALQDSPEGKAVIAAERKALGLAPEPPTDG